MLYIWPYILFFSIPITYPYFLAEGASIYQQLFKKEISLPRPLLSFSAKFSHRGRWSFLGLAIWTTIFIAIIRYNTIVHPFTLADNRHYVFYVFRILVLRNSVNKYLAAPTYVISAWLVIQTLRTPRVRSKGVKGTHSNERTVPLPDQVETRTPFVLIWMATSALSLITAPLVEPRYFILPWVLWRLQVPSPSHLERCREGKEKDEVKEERPQDPVEAIKSDLGLLFQTDHRLWLETVWLLSINVATGYLFLYKGFKWEQEPGIVQRFLW